MADLSVQLGEMSFCNPVCLASGTAGYGPEVASWYDLNELGGFFSKALTLEPRSGNALPRVCELPTGMLNTIGLANPGVSRFISEQLPGWEELKTRLFVNVAGSTADDYVECCRRLEQAPRLDGLEINVSCPNVKQGGISFSADLGDLAALVRRCRETTRRLLIIKLSPQVTDIVSVAQVCADEGADAISLINTIPGMSIDIGSRRTRLSTGIGGYSGPGIKPVALAQVYRVARAVSLPIIGIGGISSAADILEFILAGASVIQVGTYNFVQPDAGRKLVKELDQLCHQLGIEQLSSAVGTVELPVTTA
ncbi:MAG: dihydroorotate dehydrogenase [Candidatus Delongbacteria bacterium]|nr:dihydroorotate dehydrogenase [Candidatus Delongbacteria bacterium]